MYLNKYTEYLDPRLLRDSRYAIHRRNCSTFSFTVLKANDFYPEFSRRNYHKSRVLLEYFYRPNSPVPNKSLTFGQLIACLTDD